MKTKPFDFDELSRAVFLEVQIVNRGGCIELTP